jgi:hypothetical protein
MIDLKREICKLAYLLLYDSSNMGVGSVCSQGENCPREGVGQGYSSN